MRKWLLLLPILFYSGISFAQVHNIVIDSALFNVGPNEPCIAIDPSNPNHIVAGSNTKNVYTSIDGGLTWYKNTLHSTFGVFGDPVIVADTSGSFYYFHLCQNDSITVWPQYADRILCQRTDDISSNIWTNGGYTGWADEPKVEDKAWAVVDNQSNTIYVSWTRFDSYASTNHADSSIILFSKSIDKGDTWSPAMRLSRKAGDCTDESGTDEGAVPCIGTHGEVFVSWAEKDAIVFNRSIDGGNTWLDSEVYVTNVPGGWSYNVPGLFRCNGLPYTACDVSNSAYKGTIYINWTDQRNGINNTDVWICKSTDSGNTWSSPIKVNDDTGARQQFMSSMSVDPITGYIYVLFYDRRNYYDSSIYRGNFQNPTDVYLAISKDGANSFQNYQISDAPFFPRSGIFFGDYTYVAAYNNVIRPIWGCLWDTGTVLATQDIRTAIIDSSILGFSTPTKAIAKNSLDIYPNPVSDRATISFDLSIAGNVNIYLTDISGRKIEVLKRDEYFTAGTHYATLNCKDSNIPPGVYLLCLKSDNYIETKKILVTK